MCHEAGTAFANSKLLTKPLCYELNPSSLKQALPLQTLSYELRGLANIYAAN
jgi:hypothetical protein